MQADAWQSPLPKIDYQTGQLQPPAQDPVMVLEQARRRIAALMGQGQPPALALAGARDAYYSGLTPRQQAVAQGQHEWIPGMLNPLGYSSSLDFQGGLAENMGLPKMPGGPQQAPAYDTQRQLLDEIRKVLSEAPQTFRGQREAWETAQGMGRWLRASGMPEQTLTRELGTNIFEPSYWDTLLNFGGTRP
jgi:hypothetical protein